MKSFDITNENENNALKNLLFKSFQSCNINFLFGAGTSYPAISTLGNVENEVQELVEKKETEKADVKLFKFLKEIYDVAIKINDVDKIEDKINETKINYNNFVSWINKILLNRKNDITKSSANIFTTNYDLFLEYACELQGNYFNYNDGFSNKNNIFSVPKLNVSEFNKTISYCTNLYQHSTILPNVNVVKLHGSLNWNIEANSGNIVLSDISNIHSNMCQIYENKKENGKDKTIELIVNVINSIGVIMPKKEKFRKTVMEQSYYSFLRYFSNELEKENGILFTIGFSFEDEHIRDLVKKALSTNPTLQLYISVFNKDCYKRYEEFFRDFSNVSLIFNGDNDFTFKDCYQKLNTYFEDLITNA